MTRILVLGIGNVLLTDEGAGVHAARRLSGLTPLDEGLQVLDGGTVGLALAPLIEQAERLIVLDAMQLGEAGGAVQVFLDDEMDRCLGRRRLSVHEVSLRDILDAVRLSGRLPRQRALIGIQPCSLDWGLEPTPSVALAIESASRKALELIERWPAAGEDIAES